MRGWLVDGRPLLRGQQANKRRQMTQGFRVFAVVFRQQAVHYVGGGLQPAPPFRDVVGRLGIRRYAGWTLAGRRHRRLWVRQHLLGNRAM